MKITIKCNDATHAIDTVSDHLHVSEVVDYIYLLLHSVGYHPDSIKTAFIDKGDLLYSEEADDKDEVLEHLDDLDKNEPPDFEKTVSVNSRYNEKRQFHLIDGVWYFDVCNDYSVGISINEDGTYNIVDPSGGPAVAVDTCLYDIHSDLPKVYVQEIKFDKKYKLYKLIVTPNQKK